jgi:hypothetical protein
MSHPLPDNCADEYKYPCPKTQKRHRSAMFCNARRLRRLPKRSPPSWRMLWLEQPPLYKFCPTLYKFVQDKKFFPVKFSPKM